MLERQMLCHCSATSALGPCFLSKVVESRAMTRQRQSPWPALTCAVFPSYLQGFSFSLFLSCLCSHILDVCSILLLFPVLSFSGVSHLPNEETQQMRPHPTPCHLQKFFCPKPLLLTSLSLATPQPLPYHSQSMVANMVSFAFHV